MFGGFVVCWLWRSGVGGGLFDFVISVLLFAYVIWFNSVGYNWFFGGCWFIVFWLWWGVMIASFLGFELIAVVAGYLWVVWFGFWVLCGFGMWFGFGFLHNGFWVRWHSCLFARGVDCFFGFV